MAPCTCSATRAVRRAASDAYAFAIDAWIERCGSPPDIEREHRVRTLVLHSLEAAYGYAELAPLLGVVDRDLDERGSNAAQLRRGRKRATVTGILQLGRSADAGGVARFPCDGG